MAEALGEKYGYIGNPIIRITQYSSSWVAGEFDEDEVPIGYFKELYCMKCGVKGLWIASFLTQGDDFTPRHSFDVIICIDCNKEEDKKTISQLPKMR